MAGSLFAAAARTGEPSAAAKARVRHDLIAEEYDMDGLGENSGRTLDGAVAVVTPSSQFLQWPTGPFIFNAEVAETEAETHRLVREGWRCKISASSASSASLR